MKTKILIIGVSVVSTVVIVFLVLYFALGLNSKPMEVISVDSPNDLFNAYVVENPAFDSPNQSLFIAKKGQNEFRLVEQLPEDIEAVTNIYWSDDSKIVVFATNWHLIITYVDSFNSKKISINPDWWKKLDNKNGKFLSSKKEVRVTELNIHNSDSICFKTSENNYPETIIL